MAYQLRLKPSAQKQLDKLEQRDRLRVEAMVIAIRENPFAGKKLKGEYEGSYTVRAWPIRIIYDVYKKDLLVLVIRIKHRGGAYR